METSSRVRPLGALWIALLAVVAAAGIAIGLLIDRGDAEPTVSTDPTVQLASVQQAWMRDHMNDWAGHHDWEDWSEHGPGRMGR